MPWERRERGGNLIEWERSDGNATVRLREAADGGWVLRLDRLEQAPECGAYRRERLSSREAALERATEWRRAYDVG